MNYANEIHICVCCMARQMFHGPASWRGSCHMCSSRSRVLCMLPRPNVLPIVVSRCLSSSCCSGFERQDPTTAIGQHSPELMRDVAEICRRRLTASTIAESMSLWPALVVPSENIPNAVTKYRSIACWKINPPRCTSGATKAYGVHRTISACREPKTTISSAVAIPGWSSCTIHRRPRSKIRGMIKRSSSQHPERLPTYLDATSWAALCSMSESNSRWEPARASMEIMLTVAVYV